MDPSAVGVRLASGVVAPLVRKLFVKEGPGAGLVAKPVRISGPVSFKGEQRTLTGKDLHKLAAELVDRAVRTAGAGERPPAADEERAVADALATTLRGLGELDMDDAQAVRRPSAVGCPLRSPRAGRPRADLRAGPAADRRPGRDPRARAGADPAAGCAIWPMLSLTT
ncbi:NACHT N-terminal Helical domain 1-containing protein [Streptomyces tubercidicus]|uniref:NACHT N-terminal Helical domain 1-containing protein n=1 Tax=Streptomyces tubercidicus TaxID=47759 RepID=UPI003F5C2BE4